MADFYASGGTVNSGEWVVLGEDGCTFYRPASRITTSTMAAAVSVLARAGFTVESATRAVAASDDSLLRHSGTFHVQLEPPSGDDDPGTAGVLAKV